MRVRCVKILKIKALKYSNDQSTTPRYTEESDEKRFCFFGVDLFMTSHGLRWKKCIRSPSTLFTISERIDAYGKPYFQKVNVSKHFLVTCTHE